MAMHPEMAAGLIGIGMMDMVRAAARVATDAGTERSYNAWHGALAAARNDAAEIATVAVGAISRIADLEDEVADLEAENAKLRRALAQRDRVLQSLRQ